MLTVQEYRTILYRGWLTLDSVPAADDLSTLPAAKRYWDAHFGGKSIAITVRSGGREIPVKVRFDAGNDHAYTSDRLKSGVREFDEKRAQAMPRIMSVIEHPKTRVVGPGMADLLFERVINGEHYTVVLTWRGASKVYEFHSAHFKPVDEVRRLLGAQGRKRNEGPLQR